MHDMIATATRGISWDARTLGPDIALDVLVGKHQDLALRDEGLTRLLLDADETIGAPGIARPGHCAHCGGSGQGQPLWTRSALGKLCRRRACPDLRLDDQFQRMPAGGVGWAAAEATARRSGGGLPALLSRWQRAVRRQGRLRGA